MGYLFDKNNKEINNSKLDEIEYNKIPFGCWIDLDGNIYKTPYASHCIMAHRILYIKFKERIDDEIEFEDNDRLIKKGWKLIQRVSNFCDTFYINVLKLELITPKQHQSLKKIKEVFEKENKKFIDYEWDSLK